MKSNVDFEKINFSRRNFVKKSAFALAGSYMLGMSFPAIGRARKDSLFVIAYNIYLGRGWPMDRKLAEKVNQKGQIPIRLSLELSLYDPDIIAFAESPEEPIIKEIANKLNMDYVFFQSAGNWPGAILTHHKIIDSENVPFTDGRRPEDLFTRHWGKATIGLKNDRHIIVHSSHLYPHDNPSSKEIREREIREILNSVQGDVNNGKSILMLGDLNHRPDMPEYEMWMNAGWVDTFDRVGHGNGSTIRADQPDRRIDYVLAHGPIAENVREARVLFEGAFRTNPDDPSSFSLSDHLPVLAEFEI